MKMLINYLLFTGVEIYEENFNPRLSTNNKNNINHPKDNNRIINFSTC